jgi:hypothetical protein
MTVQKVMGGGGWLLLDLGLVKQKSGILVLPGKVLLCEA